MLAGLVAGSLWWLQAPPRTSDSYRERAAKQAELLISHVETARLWADGVAEDEVTFRAATVGLHEAETDAARVSSGFESLDPPRGQDELQARFSDLGHETSSALSRVGLAARRGRWQEVTGERDALAAIVRRLHAFVRSARA